MSTANVDAPLNLAVAAVQALVLYSLAEFQSGNASTIRVTANGASFGVADDGRGHPIDKQLEGTSYLKFVYSHFEYPFEAARQAPIQLQGIGMSLLNAMCSELTLTVRKPDETLQLCFLGGQLAKSSRTAARSPETGITVAATLHPALQTQLACPEQLVAWLLGVLATCPSLKLFFNGQQLQLQA